MPLFSQSPNIRASPGFSSEGVRSLQKREGETESWRLQLANGPPLHLRTASADLDWKIRFRIIAAKASRQNKKPDFYSRSEACLRDELVKMGFIEGESFLHQHKIFGYLGKRGQKVYYWLDLFIPSLLLDIEADGEIWHQFFDMKARDRRRDSILRKRYGIKVIRLSSYHLRKKRLGRILAGQIERRGGEVSRAPPWEPSSR